MTKPTESTDHPVLPAASRRMGVCSWSLQATGPDDLIAKLKACDAKAVQLALEPLREAKSGSAWDAETTFAKLAEADITVLSGMMETVGEDYSTLESIKLTGGLRPDAHWKENLGRAKQLSAICEKFGIGLLTLHAGFLPHDEDDRLRARLLERLEEIAETVCSRDIVLGLETGQEDADTLLTVLDDIDEPMVGANFDPANMILYNMGDPVAALRTLADSIVQLHIKDATYTTKPSTWGVEVPVGTGAVNWDAFFKTLSDLNISGDLVIEREAGTSRLADISTAAKLVRRYVSGA